jgi:L-amino acid N-acyltransferase YncA
MRVRPATSADADAIHAIYAHHVLHGVGTFEEEPPDLAEIGLRMRRGHWVVAAGGGQVGGYAYYGPYRPRSAYRFTVEDSIYVHPDAMGRGVGSLLLAALVEHAEAAGYRQMVAAVGSSDNIASIALHERHGFVRAGLLADVGLKFGRSLDVVLLQRGL